MVENRNAKHKAFYSFSRQQLAALAVAFVLGSVFVFLVGVFIGQTKEKEKLLDRLVERPTVRIPVQPLPTSAESPALAPGEEELTFHDTLTKKVPATEAQSKETRQSPPQKQARKTKTKKSVLKQKKPAEKKEPKGSWTVQVNAFPDNGDAMRLMRRLRSKGFDAYVVSTKIRNRIWYRVRIGRLATKTQARDLQAKLEGQEGFKKTFITKS